MHGVGAALTTCRSTRTHQSHRMGVTAPRKHPEDAPASPSPSPPVAGEILPPRRSVVARHLRNTSETAEHRQRPELASNRRHAERGYVRPPSHSTNGPPLRVPDPIQYPQSPTPRAPHAPQRLPPPRGVKHNGQRRESPRHCARRDSRSPTTGEGQSYSYRSKLARPLRLDARQLDDGVTSVTTRHSQASKIPRPPRAQDSSRKPIPTQRRYRKHRQQREGGKQHAGVKRGESAGQALATPPTPRRVRLALLCVPASSHAHA
ncbi:hypothetical protein C8Q78DRAFT_1052067 [Trametes maxima]|nr:hypothetical protein C8Q78DRAFT_1052067 [Trametes maxima]